MMPSRFQAVYKRVYRRIPILNRKFKTKNRSKITISKRIYSPPNSLNGPSSVPEHSPPTSTVVESAQEHGTYELGGE
jgi:hypothetical protein